MTNRHIIIPARLQSTRLANKLLLEIAGKPIIEHVYSKAMECHADSVIVATDSIEIAAVIKNPKTSFSLVFEMSDDPKLINNYPKRLWFGADFSYKIDNHNTLSIFAGQRRGGPACTSGICYEVLDFEGVELRFTTKF